LFITFEGIEGSGKSTQGRLLYDFLINFGYPVLYTREPGGPPISEAIRDIILDPNNHKMAHETELLLYLAARNQHTVETIIPSLNEGKIVICDRYIDSTVAYQGAARKLDRVMIDDLNKFASRGLLPDVTFIIDISVELSMNRLAKRRLDRMEKESMKFHLAVRHAFVDMAKKDKRFILIDGSKPIAEISEEIINIIKNKFLKGEQNDKVN
jgi:dTMP kinase